RQDKVGARSVDVIELVPAVPDLPFERAIVWLDRADALPRRLEITERGGAIRTLTLSKVQVNQRVPDSTFTFTVPSGVRIVDQ
ncbi:MAG: outer membrane lipoprotein carrier protein LolA, partial [Gemmatimonadetes bacterium]|nr:outer membrane lipoprotein carrier protein LolA [Gemmatimonadota bacterium]